MLVKQLSNVSIGPVRQSKRRSLALLFFNIILFFL